MRVIDIYERHARAYDRDRSRSLQERVWLDRFLTDVPTGGTVLDVGGGSGEPIARYLIDRGLGVVGLDASPSMIDMCRVRFPDSEWLVLDMREMELERCFEGIVSWDSFFHLTIAERRDMFPRYARHARRGAPLMFTSGPAEGEAIGSCFGESLYHASLGIEEYHPLLSENGVVLKAQVTQDAESGDHTVWLATYEAQPAV